MVKKTVKTIVLRCENRPFALQKLMYCMP